MSYTSTNGTITSRQITKISHKSLNVPDKSNQGVQSSGVTFYPNRKYWQIGGKYYDLEPFLEKHPGGQEVLMIARDRFEDHTYAFESHHSNIELVRKMLEKYEVKGILPPEYTIDENGHKMYYPKLCTRESFYSVLRMKVHEYLKRNKYGSGPSLQCLLLNFVILFFNVLFMIIVMITGNFLLCPVLSFFSTLNGAFGHNWIHQPRYKSFGYLTLNINGFCTDVWFREHNLQHHTYTNTPLDNHYKGVEPFLVNDPTKKRNAIQRILPYLIPLVLFFGTIGNYITVWIMVFKHKEKFFFSNCIFGVIISLFVYFNGMIRGMLLILLWMGIQSIWYFSIALWNHNTPHTLDLDTRDQVQDFGHYQLSVSSDIGTDLTFLQSWKYLWLNFHTVHHLFPHVDFCHHSHIQKIIIETCKEFKINYNTIDNFFHSFKEMIDCMSYNLYSSDRLVRWYASVIHM